MRFKEIIKEGNFKEKLILLSIPVILTVYIYHGMPSSFANFFPSFSASTLFSDFYSHIYQFISVFILLFLFPAFIVKFIFKERLKNYGFSLGDKKYGFKFVLFTIPFVIFPIIWFASNMANIQAEYPMSKSMLTSTGYIAIYEFFYIFYYFGWEFFFRGYILFGLRERFGNFYSILIQTIPSVLLHIGKPEGETIGAIIVGIGFGYLALRTKSIFWPFLIHLFCGVVLDIFIIIQTIITA
ncbi:MAG: CPBP family intramembrane glutamic endopeptidase [Candidatus Aminicenantia bacterium]